MNCLPGFTIVGSGFDVWTGSLKKSVVAYSFQNSNTYSGKRVPDQQQVTPDNRFDIGVKVETFDSVDNYRKSFALNIGTDASLKGVSLGGSLDISKKYSQYGSISSKLFKAVKKASLWKTTLSKTDLDHMTSDLKTTVQDLPSEYSYGTYLYFIEKFGTHIVTEASFGGMYIMESFMCSSIYKSSKSDNFKLMASVGLGDKASASIGKSSMVAQDTGEEQLIRHISIQIYGGNPSKLCCSSSTCTWENWYGDVKDKPYHVSYRVMPISHVLRSKSKYLKQADNLDKAVNEYLEKKSLSIVKGGNLKCPPKSDAAAVMISINVAYLAVMNIFILL